MKKKSVTFTADVLRGQIPSVKNPDWIEILGFLNYRGLAGVFLHSAKDGGLDLPADVWLSLRDTVNHQEAENRLIRKWVYDLTGALDESGVAFALAGESALCSVNLACGYVDLGDYRNLPHTYLRKTMEANRTFYAAGERKSRGIEILTSAGQAKKTAEALCKLGFERGVFDPVCNSLRRAGTSEAERSGGTYYVRTGDPALPVLKADIVSEPEAMLSEMLGRRKDYLACNGKKLTALEPSDFLFWTIVRADNPCRLYDVYRFIERAAVDEKTLRFAAGGYRMRERTARVLRAAAELVGDAPLFDLAERVDREGKSR